MIPPQSANLHQWDLTVIFPDDAAFFTRCDQVAAQCDALSLFKGALHDAVRLFEYFESRSAVQIEVGRIMNYAGLTRSMDNSDSRGLGLHDRARSVAQALQMAVAFADPELLTISTADLEAAITTHPPLERYRRTIEKFNQLRPYTPDEKTLRISALASKALATASDTYNDLVDSDLRFREALDSAGVSHAVTQGSIDKHLSAADRILRRDAFNSYADAFLAHRNTLAASYRGLCASSNFSAVAVRNYPSVLHANTFRDEVDREIFQTTIDTCCELQPVWRRFFEVKAKFLGLDRLAEFDIHAPLDLHPPQISYDRACELIIKSLEPLGADYQQRAQRGLNEDHWVDVYPRQGKSSNAFSSGSYLTPPFILMNYNDSFTDVGTLAHELGHSMHSLLAKSQPPIYAGYSPIIAETASNFNQALLRRQIVESGDPSLLLAMLDETFANFHRYTFLFPVLAGVEHDAHERILSHKPITADSLSEKCVELFSNAYGDSLTIDRDRAGIRWAQFEHFYMPYYLYSYAIGISAANVLADRVLAGDTDTRDRYLQLLESGSSRSVIDLNESVGINPRSPEMIRGAFAVLTQYIDLLEKQSPKRG